tara:strand:- start:114 stop:731 length:618 start_codon:yes stop_codon:yes gene_type:complete
MLLANNIVFKRNNRYIIKDTSVSLAPKKIVHLKGNNGVGKTTLLKLLSNILIPDDGEIFWNGKNINKKPYDFYKETTFIMDKPTSISDLTVKENIFFWKKLFSSQRTIKEIDSVLNIFSLQQYYNTQINYLSYGEIKKLELSRLIIEQKKLWILDEPFAGLDIKTIELIHQTIINHAELGGMVIFTSHLDPNINNLENLNLEFYE